MLGGASFGARVVLYASVNAGQVDVLELKQKVQAVDSLQKELDLVRRQRAAAEEAAANAAQKPSTGVWSWLAGHQQDQRSVEV